MRGYQFPLFNKNERKSFSFHKTDYPINGKTFFYTVRQCKSFHHLENPF